MRVKAFSPTYTVTYSLSFGSLLYSPILFFSCCNTQNHPDLLQIPMVIISPTLFCLSIVILASIVIPVTFGASDVLSDALLSIKSDLTDVHNGLSDWFLPVGENPSSGIAACSWSGVICNSNSTMLIGLNLSGKGLSGELSSKHFQFFTDIVTLNLSHNQFSGRFPDSVFNLINLRSLDISRNSFRGNFPVGISKLKKLVVLNAFSNSFSGTLPVEVTEIESLRVVNFAGSYFSGVIPAEYGNFKNLQFIQLAGNLLGGEIPPELGKLQTVTHMEIGYNSYQGGIPWQISNMSELHYLDIAGANLSGVLPKELSNLSKLESLFLFKNQIHGLLPKEFSKLVSLKSLDLSVNFISGEIPESFSDLKNLSLLSLMFNEMSGHIPQAIAELPMLETLLIWSNSFSGPLPYNLGMNSKLQVLDVSTNNFNGSIPPHLCANGMLSKLILFSNYFSGELPLFLSKCPSLVRIRFEDNALTGPISLNFTSLPDISYVDLSRNNFSGGLPEGISFGSKLEYFNVSDNLELGGDLPRKLWSLPLLQNFSASSCDLSGYIPPFESCKSLNVVELSLNRLSGNVPENISECQFLSSVDLSHNNLSGSIPEELRRLSSLQLLNVSYNDISGSIPESDGFNSMDKTAFLGNPRLCGAPLAPCSSSKKIQTEFLWVLILCVTVVAFIALAISGVYYVRKVRKSGQWKMVSFDGFPNFTANDVLKSFNSTEFLEPIPYGLTSSPICKVTLPTGITVLVKKIELGPEKMEVMEEFVVRLGNTRHKNLTRLLGYCYNKDLLYLLYDYLPNQNLAEKITLELDLASKYKIVLGIANGLCFLHQNCHPAIPHGDVRTSNVVFGESLEPKLAEFGFRFLMQLNKGSITSTYAKMQGDQCHTIIKEELSIDISNFGEIILEILTNGRIKNVRKSANSKTKEAVLEEVCKEIGVGLNDPSRKKVDLMLQAALPCINNGASERPSIEAVVKLLRGSI